MSARIVRLVTFLAVVALLSSSAAPTFASAAEKVADLLAQPWATEYGARPDSFKQGGGRYAAISVTPTADCLALVTVRDSRGTIATLGYGTVRANRRASWNWYGTDSAGRIAPSGTYTYWIRLTRGRTSHWYKGQVSKYATKVVVPISGYPGYTWGTDGVTPVHLTARPAYFSIVLKAPFFDAGTGQPQTVHDSVWLTNGNNVPLAGVPFYFFDHVAMTTGDADLAASTTRIIPSPGDYRLHWIVESLATVTIRQ